MNTTAQQYDTIIRNCFEVFVLKTKDYGTAWRLFRISSLTDQLYIKAQRIRTIELGTIQKIEDSIISEYQAIINYGIIALIQLELNEQVDINLSEDDAKKLYSDKAQQIKELMLLKNHDYGEAWRSMRVTSFTDMILTKLHRIKQIEDNQGKTLISEGYEGHFMDVVNYSVFALITLSKDAV